MKKPYEEILNTTIDGYRIEVKRNSSKFVVKVAKAEMKNFDKKAPPEYFKGQQGLRFIHPIMIQWLKKRLIKPTSLFSVEGVRDVELRELM